MSPAAEILHLAKLQTIKDRGYTPSASVPKALDMRGCHQTLVLGVDCYDTSDVERALRKVEAMGTYAAS